MCRLSKIKREVLNHSTLFQGKVEKNQLCLVILIEEGTAWKNYAIYATGMCTDFPPLLFRIVL